MKKNGILAIIMALHCSSTFMNPLLKIKHQLVFQIVSKFIEDTDIPPQWFVPSFLTETERISIEQRRITASPSISSTSERR